MENKRFEPTDLIFLLTHSAIALIAAFGEQIVQKLPPWPRGAILAGYVFGAWQLYRLVRSRRTNSQQEEAEQWKTFHLLEHNLLNIIGEFFKERYKEGFEIAKALRAQIPSGALSSTLKNVVINADGHRRAMITKVLSEIVYALKEDSYLKPSTPGPTVQDIFKVSFYEVAKDESGVTYLRPKYRYYPHEGEPRTQRINFGQGAAGKAWRDKKIYICENGGDDKDFEDLYPDKTQAAQYASMICIPVIVNIPEEKISEVYGILTIDSRIRRGYFKKVMEQFWGDLLQPVCNFLIYCEKSQNAKAAVGEAVGSIAAQGAGSTA